MNRNEKLALSVAVVLVVMISVSVYLIERDTIDLSSYDIRLTNPDDLDTENYALDAYDAVRIALKQVKDEQIVFIEVFPLDTRNNTKGEFWFVYIYHDPLGLPHGSLTAISIDQTGKILGINRVEWVVGG